MREPPSRFAPAPKGRCPPWGGPAADAPSSVAIVDGGSFVLPYVHGLVKALRGRGQRVTVYASRTRYNAEFLEAMRGMEGVEVVDAAVSGSVAPRWRGVLNYACLLWRLFRRRREHATINLQFSVLGPLEWPLWWLLRQRLVYTVHNAVPHGFAGERHGPTARIARLARALLFASQHTHDEFMRRYGDGFAAKAGVMPHGLLPLAPHDGAMPYRLPASSRRLVYWSTVKPYKGVELFAELARAEALTSLGVTLEVHGNWDAELLGLQGELQALGVHIDDRYLDAAALRTLFAREGAVFLLPYRHATQSGALYTLLNHGCYVICADVGDLGAFMRRFGLEGLLLRERSAAAVRECVNYLRDNGPAVQRAFAEAQRRSGWAAALASAPDVLTS